MSYPAEHWEAVALEKLSRVLGADKARALFAQALRELPLAEVRSASDLHQVAQWLTRQEGFAAGVGGLLSVHAALHGARSGAPTPR